MSEEPRVFAAVYDLDGVQRALREVAELRDLSRETIDQATGLPAGYAGKVLAEEPMKNIGRMSMGLLMTVLGVKLLVVEDEDALRRVTNRLPTRDGRSVRSRSSMPLKHSYEMRQKGRNGGLKGGKRRAQKLRPWQRRAQARKAARRRWDKAEANSADSLT